MAMARNDFKSPKHKIFAMLIAGRSKWKAKHHEVKQRLKLAGNQIRAVIPHAATFCGSCSV